MNEKIFRKEYKEVMKIWAISEFLLQFLLKNQYLKWINEESPKIKVYFFEEMGGGVKAHFSKISGVWGLRLRSLYKSMDLCVQEFVFELVKKLGEIHPGTWCAIFKWFVNAKQEKSTIEWIKSPSKNTYNIIFTK